MIKVIDPAILRRLASEGLREQVAAKMAADATKRAAYDAAMAAQAPEREMKARNAEYAADMAEMGVTRKLPPAPSGALPGVGPMTRKAGPPPAVLPKVTVLPSVPVPEAHTVAPAGSRVAQAQQWRPGGSKFVLLKDGCRHRLAADGTPREAWGDAIHKVFTTFDVETGSAGYSHQYGPTQGPGYLARVDTGVVKGASVAGGMSESRLVKLDWDGSRAAAFVVKGGGSPEAANKAAASARAKADMRGRQLAALALQESGSATSGEWVEIEVRGSKTAEPPTYEEREVRSRLMMDRDQADTLLNPKRAKGQPVMQLKRSDRDALREATRANFRTKWAGV